MELYNYDILSQLIGENVVLKDDQDHQVSLKIAEVNKGTLDGSEWEAFSVIYNGSPELSIPQGTYTLHHEKFGDESLFVSPNSDVEYETVVTRKR